MYLYYHALKPNLLLQIYDAINENPEAPNITLPDDTEEQAIIEFHSCKGFHFYV